MMERGIVTQMTRSAPEITRDNDDGFVVSVLAIWSVEIIIVL